MVLKNFQTDIFLNIRFGSGSKPGLTSLNLTHMKHIVNILTLLLITASLAAQIKENTYSWGSFDHSGWKVQPNSNGYVMIGNKFFEPNNTALYVQGFDNRGSSQFLRQHVAPGFSSLQTFWKSFIPTSDNNGNWNFFAVAAGTQSGNKVFALLVNSSGKKIWDRVSVLSSGIQFGGVTNVKNGGWLATGGNGTGNLVAVQFDHYGNLKWEKEIPISGFGWTVIAAKDGGYLIGSTGARVTKIDDKGNMVWSTAVPLPLSPDGSNYTYTEFEELIELPYGKGVVCTGSAFSNQTSAAYTAALGHGGNVLWRNIHAPQNTGLPGTPVSWINSAICIDEFVMTSWRSGPVSSGGKILYQLQRLDGSLLKGEASMRNTIPVQEAFMLHHNGQYVIGGIRGGYSAAYSWISEKLPIDGGREAYDQLQPESIAVSPNLLSGWVQTNRNNTRPTYEYHPASRVFHSEVRVFPNPSTGLINIGGKIEPGALIRVTDVMGRLVIERKIGENEVMLELDLTGIGSGIYNVEMIGSAQVISEKIIMQ